MNSEIGWTTLSSIDNFIQSSEHKVTIADIDLYFLDHKVIFEETNSECKQFTL